MSGIDEPEFVDEGPVNSDELDPDDEVTLEPLDDADFIVGGDDNEELDEEPVRVDEPPESDQMGADQNG